MKWTLKLGMKSRLLEQSISRGAAYLLRRKVLAVGIFSRADVVKLESEWSDKWGVEVVDPDDHIKKILVSAYHLKCFLRMNDYSEGEVRRLMSLPLATKTQKRGFKTKKRPFKTKRQLKIEDLF